MERHGTDRPDGTYPECGLCQLPYRGDVVPEVQQVPAKYLQIAGHLRERILSGELAPGDDVPSERALAQEWKVARPTATKALEALRMEGLVGSRQGARTFVLPRSELNRRPRERYARSQKTGAIYAPGEHARILAAEVTAPPEHVHAVLGLTGGDRVIKRSRLTLQGDQPVELSTSWFSQRDCGDALLLLKRDRILQGTVAYVESVTGRKARSAGDKISARTASAWEAEQLHIAKSSAVLVVHHVVYDAHHRPLEFAEAVYPPEAWAFEQESVL